MATEIHEGANGNLKKTEVEPLGEIKEDLKKPADLCKAGDANGTIEQSGCESIAAAEKEEPLAKNGSSKQKSVVTSGEGEEDGNEPQDGNAYSSDEEELEGEGEEDARDGDGEPYEEEEDEEYVDDGEEDEGDDDESEPPSKRRK